MKKYYKNILNNYILEYISVYKIELLGISNGYYYINNHPYKLEDQDAEAYHIKEYFIESGEHAAEILGKNFLNNSINTQFKKNTRILCGM